MKKGMEAPDYREKLSLALRSKWASGTRRKNPSSTYVKARETYSKNKSAGLHKARVITDEVRARLSAAGRVVTEAKLEANRRIARGKIGKENPPGVSSKSALHWKAKWWAFRGPMGDVISGRNLNQIIRENEHLFEADCVIWSGSKCRASKGLRNLIQGKHRSPTSWHGWVAIASFEGSLSPLEAERMSAEVGYSLAGTFANHGRINPH